MELGLAGHSGCNVQLVKNEHKFIVRKSTFDKKYIFRLKLQCEKQVNAIESNNSSFLIPNVLNKIETSDCFYFDMEYAKTVNYIEFFEQYGLNEVNVFVNNLINFIKDNISKCKIEEIDKSVFINKWNDVKATMNKSHWEWRDIIGYVDYEFNKLPSKLKLPIGKCHGDLTFSNILFQGDKQQFLIDFLDSFIETPLMDIVKIRQDTKYFWSKLMTNQKYDENHLIIISEFIDNKITEAFASEECYKEYYKPFQLMNFLRIAQYVKEDKIYNYLQETINNILGEN